MANLVVTNTFVAGTTILSAAMNTNFDDIETYINNRNSGSATWDAVYATNASTVPAVFDNGAGTNDILNCRDNGTNVFKVTNGGNCVVGGTALGTSATDGFPYVPSMGGTPSGVPTTFGDTKALVYNNTNNILYAYNSGWKGIGQPDSSTIIFSSNLLAINPDYVLGTRPAFSAYNSVTDANVTGSGGIATVDFNTEIFDQGADFSGDTFTAPVTGQYLLTTNVAISGIAAPATHFDLSLYIVTSNRNYLNQVTWDVAVPSTQCYALSIVADMDASDTAFVRVVVQGSASTIDILGDTANLPTTFQGALLF